jgi:hypothetical protein
LTDSDAPAIERLRSLQLASGSRKNAGMLIADDQKQL